MHNKIFHKNLIIKFRECDPAGIAYFANVFSWAHDTFEEFIPVAGIPWDRWFSTKTYLVPIKHTESDFQRPFKAGTTYLIQAAVEKIGNSSFTMLYRFSSASGSEIHASVRMTHVFLDAQSMQKVSIPTEVQQVLTPYLVSKSSEQESP
jgi:acyl-CoA thioesterase FadM